MNPNFIVAGVAKAGTTSLYYYLLQHPEIDIPRKETFFFTPDFYKNSQTDRPPFFRQNDRIIKSESEYDYFYKNSRAKAVGEISTCYFYFYKESIPLIKKKLGDIKIIFLLRNPVERAFSAYRHFYRTGKETFTFNEAIAHEKERMEKHWDFMWHYTAMGFYADAVKAFKESFSEVKIILAEEFYSQPGIVLKHVFEFLDVDSFFAADTSYRYNSSDSKDNPALNLFRNNTFVKKITKFLLSDKQRMHLKQKSRVLSKSDNPVMSKDLKHFLLSIYREDILQCQRLTGYDLNHWLH